MTSHKSCSHSATAAARSRCRAGRVQYVSTKAAADLDLVTLENVDLTKAVARTASLGITIPHTDAAKPEHVSDADWHLMLRNRARFTTSSWPTDEERAAALADVARRDHAAGRVVAETVYGASDLATPDEVRYALDPIAARKTESSRIAGEMLPTFANARRLAADIPEGRYAVRDADDIKFYKIDKPAEGSRWAGYVFLKIQASDNEHAIKSAARQMSVYSQILEAGIAESSRLYGVSLGSCGVCGRTLTDAESIAAGIGPVCARKMGW